LNCLMVKLSDGLMVSCPHLV